MPIHKPGHTLGQGIPLKSVKTRGSHGRKSPIAFLNITPMVDMFTVLVIFLIQQFSVTGELGTLDKDVKIPEAKKFTQMDQMPVISVSNQWIMFEGRKVKATPSVLEAGPGMIEDLGTELESMKNNYKRMGMENRLSGGVIIQADQKVPFSIIKKVLLTCATKGFTKINYAVFEKKG